MTRRILAAVAAVLLAALGAWVILSYVRGAEDRAQAAEQLTAVLVVTQDVPVGTSAEDLGTAVELQQVPTRLVAASALTDLTTVAGLVTTAELLPGDQLQSGRFGDPAARRADGSLPTPSGLVEVSATLDVQRAAGGTLTPGDLVGITLTSKGDGGSGLTSLTTFQVLHEVLVTRVVAPTDSSAPWLVTLAVTPDDASTVVLGLEGQAVWLSLEDDTNGSTPSTTPGTTSVAITGDDQ